MREFPGRSRHQHHRINQISIRSIDRNTSQLCVVQGASFRFHFQCSSDFLEGSIDVLCCRNIFHIFDIIIRYVFNFNSTLFRIILITQLFWISPHEAPQKCGLSKRELREASGGVGSAAAVETHDATLMSCWYNTNNRHHARRFSCISLLNIASPAPIRRRHKSRGGRRQRASARASTLSSCHHDRQRSTAVQLHTHTHTHTHTISLCHARTWR